MKKKQLIIDEIKYLRRDKPNKKIENAIEKFFEEIKHNVESDDLVVAALREYSIAEGVQKERIIRKLDSRIGRIERNQKRDEFRDKRMKKEKDILKLLKEFYLKWNHSQINKFRGCLFEEVIGYYVKVPEKIFGAGIVENSDEKEIKIVKHICYKKEKESNNILFKELNAKRKINIEEYDEIKKRINNIKTTRETCDIIFKRNEKLYLVEIKLSPNGFDCFSTTTLAKMGEYLNSKGVKKLNLVCLTTWSDDKTSETFNLNIKECSNKCLTKKLKEQRVSFKERFIVLGFYKLMEMIKEENKKTA